MLYCALCQVSCGSQSDLNTHLAGINHKYKANKEKEKKKENAIPKEATMLSCNDIEKVPMEKFDVEDKKNIFFCELCNVGNTTQNILEHLENKDHKSKARLLEKQKNRSQGHSKRKKWNDLDKHLARKKYKLARNIRKEKANTEKKKFEEK